MGEARRKRRQQRRRKARRREDRGHWQSFIATEGRLTYSIRAPRTREGKAPPYPQALMRKEAT